jgi:hypothetical protein
MSENAIAFSKSRKMKNMTTPLKYRGTGIHTLKYFEDQSLSLTHEEYASHSTGPR